MRQRSVPKEIVSCAVCSVNNCAREDLIPSRSTPYEKCQENLRKLLAEIRDGTFVGLTSREMKRKMYPRIGPWVLNENDYAKNSKDSWEVHIEKLILMNQKHKYGPYNSRHINAALEVAGITSAPIVFIMKRFGLPLPQRYTVSLDTIDALLRQIHEKIPAWKYPNQFMWHTESRKYPGHDHGVAFRKIGGRWILFDSEMKSPETSCPSNMDIRSISLLMRKTLVPESTHEDVLDLPDD